MAPSISATPSKSNDPILSMGGPLGLPDSHLWGDASKWSARLPDPVVVDEYKRLNCQPLLHLGAVRSLQDIARYFQVRLATRSIENQLVKASTCLILFGALSTEFFIPELSQRAAKLFMTSHVRPTDPNDAVPILISLMHMSVTVNLFIVGVFLALDAGMISLFHRWTPASELARFERCKELQWDIRPAWVFHLPRTAIFPTEPEVTLPQDIGLGVTAVPGAMLSRGGTGEVDLVMNGLSLLIGVGTGSLARVAIAAPRSAPALRSLAAAVF